MDSGVGKLSDFDNIQIRTPSLPCHLTVVLWIENMLWMYVIVKLCQCDWSVIVWLIGVSVVLMICDNVTVIISCDMISFRHNFTIIIRISFVNWRLQLLLTILIFFTSDNGDGKCDFPRCLSVYLSVSKITPKRMHAMHRFRWHFVCRHSRVVRTWTNRSTFEPDPYHSRDAGNRLLSAIAYALQRRILLRLENPTYRYWVPVVAVTHGFEAPRHHCRR